MQIDQEVWWVIHSECPIGQRFQREHRLDLLAAMTVALERHPAFPQLQKWLAQDRTSQNIEAFRSDKLNVVKIRRFSSPGSWGQ
jgi:hypothetical protein